MIVTVSAAEVLPPAVTVRLKVRVAAEEGAVNVGLSAEALLRVTVGPAVWDQAQVRVSPSGS